MLLVLLQALQSMKQGIRFVIHNCLFLAACCSWHKQFDFTSCTPKSAGSEKQMWLCIPALQFLQRSFNGDSGRSGGVAGGIPRRRGWRKTCPARPVERERTGRACRNSRAGARGPGRCSAPARPCCHGKAFPLLQLLHLVPGKTGDFNDQFHV